ncbi:UNVERIFIED_CONTAM: hypothetical protein Sindi_2536200 [Sesamum indicum]
MAVVLTPLPLSFQRSLYLCPCRTSFQSPSNIPRRFITFAVVKRSPKRLKYSSPRFTKEDGLLYVEVDPWGADSWKLDPIVELLKQGAVGVIPTDTVVKSPKENEWMLDPVVIADVYGPEGLDFVVAAGTRVADPSTVVDMTGSLPRIIRQGKGPKQPWMVAEEEEEEDSDVKEDHVVPRVA